MGATPGSAQGPEAASTGRLKPGIEEGPRNGGKRSTKTRSETPGTDLAIAVLVGRRTVPLRTNPGRLALLTCVGSDEWRRRLEFMRGIELQEHA